MDIETLNAQLQESYNRRFKSTEKRVLSALEALAKEKDVDFEALEYAELKSLISTLLNLETASLQDDVETLLAQKELIERSLEKKYAQLQESKYEVFDVVENAFASNDTTVAKLHQIKLQSIDLYDILSEMVESALITALERDNEGDISETVIELIKDITYEAIKEGSLSTIRVRKILSTVLLTAIDVAEATPNRAEEILGATLRGMRSGLVRSISRFKRRLAFMPLEAKHILIEDYDTIMEDLNQTDTLFTQVILTQASQSSSTINKLLVELNSEMHYDLEELVMISKETAEVMRERFSAFAHKAAKKADRALKSPTAQEAKKMGKQAWSVAKTALGSAIKTAKDVIDKK